MARVIRIALVAVAIAFVSGFSFGCENTAHGVGKDTENAGEAIQRHTD